MQYLRTTQHNPGGGLAIGRMAYKICFMAKTSWPSPGTVYRSFGDDYERYGAGFIDKSGISIDLSDYQAPSWSLVFVINGTGKLEAGSVQRRLSTGDCFMRLPGERHSNSIDPGSGWFEAFIDLGPQLYQALEQARIIHRQPLVWNWGLSDERIRRFASIRERLLQADEAQLGACGVAIQELCIDAQRSARDSRNDDPIEALCQLLSQASVRRDNLRDWVRSQGLNYERLRKAFKKRLGISPGQYRIRHRMDRACELLQHSELSITAIAYELGYPSPYEFSAQFKKQMGLTPSRYRG